MTFGIDYECARGFAAGLEQRTMTRSLLFYLHGLVGGGAERLFARLASGFAARGDRVSFVVDFEASESRALLSPAVSLRILPRGHAKATLTLAKWLAAEKPDASLSAISVSNLKHAMAATMAGRGRRAILSYHGFFESEAERLSRIGYRLTPLLSRATAATIAVAEGLRADLVNRLHASPDRTRMIYNPGAPEPFPPLLDPEALLARPPVVVAIGRLVEGKDFSTLLRAFARLEHAEARLVILGEGPLRRSLEDEARALGIAGRVAMPGFTTDISPSLRGARCVAMSSRRESFSLVCVEALAHGLPVAATDCGGPREILNSPAFGAIVPVGDPDALAHAIDGYMTAPGDPSARQAHAAEFTLDRALDRYDALIRQVITHGRPQP
jgi:glycosyltransferase involved in cell wall biosynthesis